MLRESMDPDVTRWSIDFLLRKSNSRTQNLIKKMLRATPVSDTDSRFKKTLLLKTLEQALSTATIRESMLETLEVIEELNRCDGIPITAAMSAAYCAVAVECTLKYLEVEASISYNPAYLDAVERIWRGRVRYMDPSSASTSVKGSLLFSEELKQWRNDIEASLVDCQSTERWVGINTRRVAIQKLKAYLAEAWAELGPSFLEVAASLPMNTKGTSKEGDDEVTDMGNKGSTHSNELKDVDELGVTGEDKGPFFPLVRDDNADVCDRVSNAQTTSKEGDEGTDMGTHTNELDSGHELGVTGEKVAPIENETTTATDVDVDVEGVDLSRFHLPSPKRKNISPLKKYEPQKLTRRRRMKKWSAAEEEALRSAVNKFGEGNWKLILNSNADIFAERTPMDLKDKWRNIMRYGGK